MKRFGVIWLAGMVFLILASAVEAEPKLTQVQAGALMLEAEQLRDKGQPEHAVEIWRRVLTIPVDPDEKIVSMGGRTDHRGWAQWNIAESLFKMGRYEEALSAYKDSLEKFPRLTGCVPDGSSVQESLVGIGLCLEHLNRHNETAQKYFLGATIISNGVYPTSAIRLVELYAASHQLDDLQKSIDAADNAFRAQDFERLWGRRPSDNDMERDLLPGRHIRRVLELHRLEAAQQWGKLIDLLRAEAPNEPEELIALNINWPTALAAQLLARHPRTTVALLNKAIIDNATNMEFVNDRLRWLYLALGLAASPDAIAALEREYPFSDWAGAANTKIFAFKLARASGTQALADLLKKHPDWSHMVQYIQTNSSLSAALLQSRSNTPIPKNLKLPTVLEAPKVL